jgi:hypothetical protein
MSKERRLLEKFVSWHYKTSMLATLDILILIREAEKLLAQEEIKTFNWEEAPTICVINGYRWQLGPEADKKLNWQDARDWCVSVGGELPPRNILLQCFLDENIKPLFKEEWYWSSTYYSATYAWVQFFSNGNQLNNAKTYNLYVRAVRKVLI